MKNFYNFVKTSRKLGESSFMFVVNSFLKSPVSLSRFRGIFLSA